MDFPTALSVVLTGGRVRRAAWSPDAFLLDIPGSGITVDADRPLGQAAPELVGQQIGYSPHIDVCVDGHLVPWTANQTDMHAHDWEIR